ncbi:MAG TPA: flagellar motor protein MotB [Candidatus Mediterraneibacter norfolkensis]|nr:flagellar motor protein MotB [Candidatus Mediterraneibacter norfolkensis]
MKKQRKGADGGSWMDTYGDMVTLLLCFFVLLYAISSVDQNKYQNLVASVNPEMAEELQEMRSAEAAEQQAQNAAIETMYENLRSQFEAMGLDANVDVIQGDGYNFISFSDEVFFEADSYSVTENGRAVLDAFCQAIEPASEEIHEIQVLGHTTEVPDHLNVVEDRMLSSERAAQVAAYIQQKNVIDPARLVSLGFGQFRPIADINTPEGRSRNRRVEILITNDEAVMKSLTEYYSEVYGQDVAAMQPDANLYQDTQTGNPGGSGAE